MAVDNEEEYLKAVLANNDVLSDTIDIVKSRDFRAAQNRIIYDTILDGWEKGHTIDPPVLVAELERTGRMDAAGGTSKVLDLSFGNPSQADYFAKKIRDRAELWRLEMFATELKQRASGTDEKPGTLIEWADESLANVTDEVGKKVESIADIIDDIVSEMTSPDDAPVFPTGFWEFDRKLDGGLRGGEMVIVAARPGVGKSTLAVDIVREGCIRHGKNALFFSLEMTTKELLTRIMSAEFTVRQSDFNTKSVPPEKMAEMQDALSRATGIFIDDSPNMTMADIRAKARQVNKRSQLDLIVIDYIQLLESPDTKAPRQEQVSRMSRQIKLLAKELNVPIIAVAQLNRGVEQRDNPVPKVSDLRESGSLEQDANKVILINRPDSQNPDDARAGEVDFIIGKNRGGPLGTITVASQLHYSRFADIPRAEVVNIQEWSPTQNI